MLKTASKSSGETHDNGSAAPADAPPLPAALSQAPPDPQWRPSRWIGADGRIPCGPVYVTADGALSIGFVDDMHAGRERLFAFHAALGKLQDERDRDELARRVAGIDSTSRVEARQQLAAAAKEAERLSALRDEWQARCRRLTAEDAEVGQRQIAAAALEQAEKDLHKASEALARLKESEAGLTSAYRHAVKAAAHNTAVATVEKLRGERSELLATLAQQLAPRLSRLLELELLLSHGDRRGFVENAAAELIAADAAGHTPAP